jgi:hypothetical protein
VEHAQAEWVDELTSTLAEGRVVRALRLSSRPPKAGTILKPELMAKLTAAAGAALTAEAPAERWAIVLDAITFSPVRAAVRPQSLPAEPSEELLATIRKVSTRVPDIAAAFGVEPTKAPRSRPPRGKAKPSAPKGQSFQGQPKPIPAPPARVDAKAAEPAEPAEPATVAPEVPAVEAQPEIEAEVAATGPEPDPEAAQPAAEQVAPEAPQAAAEAAATTESVAATQPAVEAQPEIEAEVAATGPEPAPEAAAETPQAPPLVPEPVAEVAPEREPETPPASAE